MKQELSEALSRIAFLEEALKRQEQENGALREADEKYRIHFSLANDIMFSYDQQLRALYVSPNVERVLGYRPDELEGKTLFEAGVMSPSCHDTAVNNALLVLSGKTVYSSVYEFIAKDGTQKFGEVSGVPVMRDGKVHAVVSVARDITGHISMERMLRDNEERYRVTLEGMPDAVVILRRDDARILPERQLLLAQRILPG